MAPQASSGTGAEERITGWASDLDLLLPGIEQIHPDPYHSTPKPQLVAAITGLKEFADQGAPVEVEPIDMADYNGWAGPYGLHLPDDPDALYLSRTDEVLWWTMLEGSHDLYVQYNRVEDLSAGLLDDLRQTAMAGAVDRIIVDIRHNFGGETFAYPPLVEVLTEDRIRSKPLFIVTGRNTFSAACLFSAEIDRDLDATFVGEPMGGSPNLFGNPGTVELPFSGMNVTVAGEYFVRSTPNDKRLTIEPDIPVALRAEDYFAHRDPSMDAILAASPAPADRY